MRESRVYGERSRTRNSNAPARKYFLVFEGTKTEPAYFKAVNNARQRLGISPLIELIPIERCRGEKGWSNPKLILDTLLDNLAERDGNTLTYSTLLNAMIDCLYISEFIRKRENIIKEIWATFKPHCEEKLGHALNEIITNRDHAIAEILKVIKETKPKIYNLILSNLEDSIKAMQITYDEDFDRLCFIFDRDRKSFTKDQYLAVLNTCNENGISVYPTNPCFEFWLLLHFDEVHNLDKEKLLANEKISASKTANTYVVHNTKKLLHGYKKGTYNTDMLMDNIKVAIKNEKKFCETVSELEDQLGSAVGLLLAEILSV